MASAYSWFWAYRDENTRNADVLWPITCPPDQAVHLWARACARRKVIAPQAHRGAPERGRPPRRGRQEAQEREEAKDCQGLEKRKEPKEPKKAGSRAVERQKNRILQLEQLVGRQAAELDFFAAALRNIEESRPTSGGESGNESMPRSKPQRKAR
jgi:hypothetical protein